MYDEEGGTVAMNKVGYFSAYYRGLDCLLDIWPKIRGALPDARLDIYYGWQSWDALSGDKDLKPRIMGKLEALKDQGVTEHGRVSHQELAKAMKQTKVWCYPTEFPEIYCITALKAQEAGCIPVTTNVAALNETVVDKRYMVNASNIYSNDYAQSRFIKNVIRALDDPNPAKSVEAVDWSDVATKWQEVISGV